MKHHTFVRTAAGVLATGVFAVGAALAQTTQPEPTTMVDTAPLPATERQSIGAVILMDEPVLAQREAMEQALARSGVDTRTLGAGPNRIMRRVMTQEEIEFIKALQEAERLEQGTPK